MVSNPIKITDTTFRDAHQSLLATRMRIEDMVPFAETMDSIGYHSMEVWGGATFDTTTRFLAEDPWERLRTFKSLITRTPLMMLLRGQSLVGYRPYADDVVEAFVGRAADAGVDIFRVFDGLNDEYNLQAAAAAVKRAGKHLQMTICYTITDEGRLGGAIYNMEYFVEKARLFESMDADSICIKDMGGLLAPMDAYDLVTELKRTLRVPLQLHTHYTSGMASMSSLKAIEAGIDVVDTCLAPLALRTSQPAVEPLVASLRGRERDSGLDLDTLLSLDDRLEEVLPKYSDLLDTPRTAVIDTRVLSHQIPGGMTSNLVSQLRGFDALDRLDDVLAEVPRTRRDMGYPPLVTPMSQMVGTQAVSNVMAGRYTMVLDQIRDYVFGLYGRPPAAIDPKLAELALEGRDEPPISGRPADRLEPEMEKAREAVAEVSTDPDDVLTYALYPDTGMRFLRIKHGLEPVPDEMKPRPPDEAKTAVAPKAQQAPSEAPARSRRTREFNVFVDGEHFRVEVDPVGSATVPLAAPSSSAAPASPPPAQPGPVPSAPASPPPQPASPVADANDTLLIAPMPGTLVSFSVEVGQPVHKGDQVAVLEAMKMQNSLPAPADGVIKELSVSQGASVGAGDVLAVIST